MTASSPAPLAVTVLLFARARELAGVPQVEVSFSGPADAVVVADGAGRAFVSLASVRTRLIADVPALQPLLSSPSTALTVNCEYVDSEATARVYSGDEVAVLPVVSGG